MSIMNRRDFLKTASAATIAALTAGARGCSPIRRPSSREDARPPTR